MTPAQHPLIASIATSGQLHPFPLLDHFDYPVLDHFCTCAVCVDWRNARSVLTTLGILSHHRACQCEHCPSTRKKRSAFVAAENRRMLFCECSWHASLMEPPELGERFMQWLLATLLDRKAHSDGWWELRGAGFSISYWQIMFRQEVFGAASVSREELETLAVVETDEADGSAALPLAAPIAYFVSGGVGVGVGISAYASGQPS